MWPPLDPESPANLLEHGGADAQLAGSKLDGHAVVLFELVLCYKSCRGDLAAGGCSGRRGKSEWRAGGNAARLIIFGRRG